MPIKINEDFPVTFPKELHDSLAGLVMRNLMTPNYLSSMAMYAILPARLSAIVEKRDALITNMDNRALKQSWSARSYVHENNYRIINNTHIFNAEIIEGMETLVASQKQSSSSPYYELYFCGNAADAMQMGLVSSHIMAEPNKVHVFWNYPGVGKSTGDSRCPQDLIEAGYKQAKRLLEGNPAKKITLRGFSLGGGVATHVARRLHEEGHLVNLEVDRSFSSLSAVIPALITKKITPQYAPIVTSIITLSIAGVSIGTTLSGFIASVGLVTASATAGTVYMIAWLIRSIGLLLQIMMFALGEMIAYPISFFSKNASNDIKAFFNLVGKYLAHPFILNSYAIAETISIIAAYVNSAINFIGSIAGGVIAFSGLLAGAVSGAIFGMLLSVQFLWTDKPLTLPLTPVFNAVLNSLCCEMNSVNEMHRMLAADNTTENQEQPQANISVINTVNDQTIDVEASLNLGLGFKPDESSVDDEHTPLKKNITSFWYRSGGHTGDLRDLIVPVSNDVIDDEVESDDDEELDALQRMLAAN